MKQLRWYQREAIDSIIEYWESNTGNPIVCIPTGGGKALIIAAFIKECMEQYPNTRFMMLTHVKELLTQNYKELLEEWPDSPAGLYSAGLNKRQIGNKITIAGIQSVYKKYGVFTWQDIVIIDECHLLSEKDSGMYRSFINGLKKINPKIKVVGFTATPYRMKQGLLTDGKSPLFNEIVYDISIRELIDKGILCPLISKHAENQVDLSSVSISNGDYQLKQMETAFDTNDLINKMLNEVDKFALDRNKRLFFSSGVQHAQHIADCIKERGRECGVIYGDMPSEERERTLNLFKTNQIRDLTNFGVLTTGYNDPSLDCIVLARGTKSVGLYVQILGRGTRTFEGKKNCLVLDFGGNIERHGPIDQIKIKPKRDGDGKSVKTAPVKICPICRSANGIAERECSDCGHQFPETISHETKASTAPILAIQTKPVKMPITDWQFKRHKKQGKPDSVKIEYRNGFDTLPEWIPIEHGGFATQKARIKIAKLLQDQRNLYKVNKVDDILNNQDWFRKPKEIVYRKVGKYEEIIDYVF